MPRNRSGPGLLVDVQLLILALLLLEPLILLLTFQLFGKKKIGM